MTFPPAICTVCRHLNSEDLNCRAYPSGIPIEILQNTVDHRRPYRGDNGIQFEANPALPADLVEEVINDAVVD